jgi:cytochrome c551/c552
VSHRIDEEAPQKLDNHIGKILRLKDDGTAPADNPYFAVEGALPEIFTWGNRSVMDFTTHPVTGAVWEIENGPQGGDEVNILKPASNFGWPIATYGRDYDGTRFSPQPWVEGTDLPELFWVPSITVAGLTFYSGDKFPKWKNNLFVTSMIVGRIPGTGHIVRVVFNEYGEVRREELLKNLKQRFRYIQQGPDQLLYALTDHSDGVLMRIEPATAAEFEAATAAGPGNAVTQAVEQGGLNDTELFTNQDCRACHRMQDALVGPAYNAIATRYALTDANVELLVGKIIEGGEGVWGETPMTPHAALARATAEQMVRAILGLTTQ